MKAVNSRVYADAWYEKTRRMVPMLRSVSYVLGSLSARMSASAHDVMGRDVLYTHAGFDGDGTQPRYMRASTSPVRRMLMAGLLFPTLYTGTMPLTRNGNCAKSEGGGGSSAEMSPSEPSRSA